MEIPVYQIVPPTPEKPSHGSVRGTLPLADSSNRATGLDAIGRLQAVADFLPVSDLRSVTSGRKLHAVDHVRRRAVKPCRGCEHHRIGLHGRIRFSRFCVKRHRDAVRARSTVRSPTWPRSTASLGHRARDHADLLDARRARW